MLLCSHDMFLKLDQYHLQPNTVSIIKLFNGTYEDSENVIDRDRMLQVIVMGNGKEIKVDSTDWYEKDLATHLKFKTGAPATYVAGVSTAARNIEMEATRFNSYLERDGVVDMLEYRKNEGKLEEDAVEKYSKHVKTIYQVGDNLTGDYGKVLGFPIEFIPLQNPYQLKQGDDLVVKLLSNSKPLADQLVISGLDTGEVHEHEHKGDKTHTHDNGEQIRTDNRGNLTLKLDEKGIYHLRTIHMVESSEEGLTHESNWATLTFSVGKKFTYDHTHNHEDGEHAHDPEFPSVIFWIASIVVIAILYFYFNRKRKNEADNQ